jgi:hypothetical protein
MRSGEREGEVFSEVAKLEALAVIEILSEQAN